MNNSKTFLKKTLLFILGFFVLSFLIDRFVKIVINQIDVGEYGVLNKIDNGKINSDILISGSSRALKALNPEIISNETGLSCFNIASDGSDLGVQLPKIKWYLNNNKNPKILILDISLFGGKISKTIYEPYKYLPYLSDDSLYQGLLNIKEDFWKNKFFFPANLMFYNFDFYVKLFLESINSFKKNDSFINGHLPDNSTWNGSFEKFKTDNPNGINCSISKEFAGYLNELIVLCKKNKIVLFLTVLPNYYELRGITNNLEEVLTYYESLKNEPVIYYFDYSPNVIFRDNRYLYNFTHLNSNGAKIFSSLISKDLVKLLN